LAKQKYKDTNIQYFLAFSLGKITVWFSAFFSLNLMYKDRAELGRGDEKGRMIVQK
jgi:hypothetical protein